MENKNKNFCVYMHKNKNNGKVYIGQTKRGDNPNVRWKNGNGYKTQIIFWRAIQKYGWDNFEHIILKDNLSGQEANEYESYYISLYKSNNNDFGYNSTSGGDNCSLNQNVIEKVMYNQSTSVPVYCPKLDMEFRTISEAARYTNTNVAHISDVINNNRRSAGVSPIDETPLRWFRLSDKDKVDRNYIIKVTNKKRKVYCLELNKVFESASEGARCAGVDNQTLLDNCNKKKYSAGKLNGVPLRWCWYDEKDQFEPVPYEKILHIGEYCHNSMKIYCIELNEIFESQQLAAKKYGLSKNGLCRCLKEFNKTCGKHPETGEKLHWIKFEQAIELGYIKYELE